MRHLPIPKDDAQDVFLTAISNYMNVDLKERLIRFAPMIGMASEDYLRAKGELRKCQLVKRDLGLGTVTDTELIAVYKYKLAKARQPGRQFYDRIISAAPLARCPLCGRGQVTQLDHNFKKAAYPVLAVTPANLVPSCGDCNRLKEDADQDDSENTLHPYFHDLENVRWLRAEVVQDSPPSVRYVVQPQHGWDDALVSRTNKHLDVYRLRQRFSVEAAQDMTEIRNLLLGLLAGGGAAAVREHLLGMAESCESACKNSWRTALYFALGENDWFCSKGVTLLDVP